MHITQLTAENVKRLSAVQITPDGNMVVIGGKNGHGKSSVLDSIAYALAGQKAVPRDPIRRGATKAQVVVDLGELVVTRVITSGSSRLEVTAKDGRKLGSPQKVLDKLVGELTFDPLEFSRLKPDKQRDVICKISGLDTAEFDTRRKSVFDERTIVNRQLRQADSALHQAPHHTGAISNETSISELTAELERRRAANAANTAKRDELNAARKDAKAAMASISALKAQLLQAEANLVQIQKAGKDLRIEVDGLKDQDTDGLLGQILDAEETSKKIRDNREHARLSKDAANLRAESEELTARIGQIDQEKADAIANAEYPVQGLGVDDDGVLLDGLPFEQASQAQQLCVSVAIGLALNPELRVLLIRDGSLLDKDSLELVAKMAEEADAQLWIERVEEDEAVTVVIEDGTVRAAESSE
jgi:DNA repair exonuclease SbcCD ATPase subunit